MSLCLNFLYVLSIDKYADGEMIALQLPVDGLVVGYRSFDSERMIKCPHVFPQKESSMFTAQSTSELAIGCQK